MDYIISADTILQTIVDCVLIWAIVSIAKSVKAIYTLLKSEIDRQRIERYKASQNYK